MQVDDSLSAPSLVPALEAMFERSGQTIRAIEGSWDKTAGAPVFTVDGRYASRGWTEWTEGFQVGSALLQYEATRDPWFFELGRTGTRQRMAVHVTHTGVHDHGFNNVSTYGNLLRLMTEGIAPEDAGDRATCTLALQASGAVQAARWTELGERLGYVYSFNGPHSLFADTIRSMRALAVSALLGHALMGEQDAKIDLLQRAVTHADTTARFNVYFGEGRDAYDVRGRVAHESIFNMNDGSYRCPSTQQGWSPFSTWTRGLAWILCGFAELVELLDALPDDRLPERDGARARFAETARATADFWIANTPLDGVPYWDTGAPGLAALGDWRAAAADPYNDHEPVDSSAAAIAAQGLLRLGRVLADRDYTAAGLTVARTLLGPPYLSTGDHEGLLLHGVYHRPNGWDHVPAGRAVPCGEAVMWGDYHLRELGVLLLREARGEPWLTFFTGLIDSSS